MNTTSEFKEPTIDQMIEYVDEKYELHKNEPVMTANDDVSADQATSWNEHNSELRDMYAGIRGQLLAVKTYNITHPHGISKLGEILDVLKAAKDSIKTWHSFNGTNSSVPKANIEEMWVLYNKNSREMKSINAMIEYLERKEVRNG